MKINTYPMVKAESNGLKVYAREDVSSNRQETLLKQQNDELRQLNADLDRFVYSAAHDLRAPLMSVMGLINMMKLDADQDNRERYLAMMEKSVHRLDNYIIDIMNYSRNARTEVKVSPVSFDTITRDTLDILKFMDGADAMQITTEVQDADRFYSDAGRLAIIFNNIISNAVRYRDVTKAKSWLHIQVKVDGEVAVLEFSDNGVGIPGEYLDRVFNMFFRAHTGSEGSGLGLYIVKETVEKMHGTVQIQSHVGEGTRLTVRIPSLRKASHAA